MSTRGLRPDFAPIPSGGFACLVNCRRLHARRALTDDHIFTAQLSSDDENVGSA